MKLTNRRGLTAEVRIWAQADRACLEQANTDTISLIHEYPRQRELILEAVDKETADSIRETCDSILSDTEFVFDDEIVTSKVYRLALAQDRRKVHSPTTLTPRSWHEPQTKLGKHVSTYRPQTLARFLI